MGNKGAAPRNIYSNRVFMGDSKVQRTGTPLLQCLPLLVRLPLMEMLQSLPLLRHDEGFMGMGNQGREAFKPAYIPCKPPPPGPDSY